MNDIKSVDTSKLLGFDNKGEPIFDIIQSSEDASSATRAAGSGKAGGIGKAPGEVKT